MMAVLWDDILEDVASSKAHFAQAVALFRAPMGDPPDYVSAAAFQHAMMAGYTSFESALRRIAQLLGEPMPNGADWHAALLRRFGRPVQGSRPALLAAPLLDQLEELRAFRHVVLHAYDQFRPRKADLAVEAAEGYLTAVDGALLRFRTAIDP